MDAASHIGRPGQGSTRRPPGHDSALPQLLPDIGQRSKGTRPGDQSGEGLARGPEGARGEYFKIEGGRPPGDAVVPSRPPAGVYRVTEVIVREVGNSG